MELVRFLLICLVCGGLALFLGRILSSGLRSGRIAHSDSSSFCLREKNPFGYWLLVFLFSGILLGCLAAMGGAFLQIIGRVRP